MNDVVEDPIGKVLSWVAGAVVLAAIIWMVLWVQQSRDAAIASGAQGPLNQLQLAFQNYHDTYGSFPPAYVADRQGRPMHSWRALILPFVDSADLYAEYDFSEPWDGPKNRLLANRMPRSFHCPSEPTSDRFTNYVVIVGPRTPFPGVRSTKMSDFKDGLDNTILVVETAASNFNWLEPRDLNAEEMSFKVNDRQRPSISTSRRNGPYVVFGESFTTYALSTSFDPAMLKGLTTIDGQEPVCMASVSRGYGRQLVSLETQAGTDAALRSMDWRGVIELWLERTDVSDAGLQAVRQSANSFELNFSGTTDSSSNGQD